MKFLASVLAAVLVLCSVGKADTYGPFYPGTLSNVDYQSGDHAWSISGSAASCSFAGEGVTKYLQVTGFGANIPTGVTVTDARLVITSVPTEMNFSDQQAVSGGGVLADAYAMDSQTIHLEDGLDPSTVNSAGFGFRFSLYGFGGGSATVTVALYIEAE